MIFHYCLFISGLILVKGSALMLPLALDPAALGVARGTLSLLCHQVLSLQAEGSPALGMGGGGRWVSRMNYAGMDVAQSL